MATADRRLSDLNARRKQKRHEAQKRDRARVERLRKQQEAFEKAEVDKIERLRAEQAATDAKMAGASSD